MMIASIPASLALDQQIRDEAPEQDYFSGGGTYIEDILSPALGLTPLALGTWSWSEGDDGQAFEVAAESLAATLIATHALKTITNRERPDGGSGSFPSGHTSWAFAGATYIGRYVEDRAGSELGHLALIPAAAVGLGRMQHNKHWASDVVVGALLGTFLTNLVWNAHYGTRGPALYVGATRPVWELAPIPMGNGIAVSLHLSL